MFGDPYRFKEITRANPAEAILKNTRKGVLFKDMACASVEPSTRVNKSSVPIPFPT